MGVRPPASDDSEVGGVEFGIADVERHLSGADISYPASATDVVEATGDPEVGYGPDGQSVPLSTVVERTDRTEFSSRQDLLNALHPVMEDLRTSRGSGVLAWVRSVLPGA
ncbi:MAG: hypothetical protein ABEJ68_03520 [Halobacteriaceae archaeon]